MNLKTYCVQILVQIYLLCKPSEVEYIDLAGDETLRKENYTIINFLIMRQDRVIYEKNTLFQVIKTSHKHVIILFQL